MKFIVFDVPAEKGGALTILQEYYEEAIKDKKNEWIFVISTPKLKETENVKILRYPWIKKSWFHRLYFDYFISSKLVKRNKANTVLSLQNTIIPRVKSRQVLYLHQPLPFVEKRFSIKENQKFWIYQNLISKLIYKSIKKADKVIVQTKWMKTACLQRTGISPNKIEIIAPKISSLNRVKYVENNMKLFFYPASELLYKNHEIIVKAVLKLQEQNLIEYKVIFTLTGEENKNIKILKQLVDKYKLPIDFVGPITSNEVAEYYSRSTLIFPSYIETFGLPMLEAKLHHSPIIASNCVFSKEILEDYVRVEFFDPFNVDELFNIMKNSMRKY